MATARLLKSQVQQSNLERNRAQEQVLSLGEQNKDLNERLNRSVQERSRLASTLNKTKGAVSRVTGSVSRRMNRAIVRNAGSVGSGMIPIFGHAADAAATAVDVAEYCQISRDLAVLNANVGNKAAKTGENIACNALRDKRWPNWPRFRWPWAAR